MLASTTQTINVTPVVEPTVTIDMPATFTVGQPMEFSISTTGGDKGEQWCWEHLYFLDLLQSKKSNIMKKMTEIGMN